MTKAVKIIIIDIGKETFDVAFSQEGKMKSRKYSATEEDMKKFISSIEAGTRCVMESTGVYHLRLAHALYEAGVASSVVNPLPIKRFTQSGMHRARTGKSDALMLAEYGRIVEPPLREPAPAHYTRAERLLNIQEQLIGNRTSVNNRMEAIPCPVSQSKTGLSLLKKQLKLMDSQLRQIEREPEALIDNNDGEDVKNLQSIPGTGRKTAVALTVYTRRMKDFDDHRKLSSYFGIAPRTVQSGTSMKRKGKICKTGTGHMRMLLYMCARPAKKYSRACRELYERLPAKGKAKKLALTAVANKLLKQAFATVKNNAKYVENYA